ncbi:MAG: DUF502 domain-containing protein [Candidatus Omnitrophica bacterium]|nr:DUF502 domain-containing protein [Candidatus Omnitrophota bacterium]
MDIELSKRQFAEIGKSKGKSREPEDPSNMSQPEPPPLKRTSHRGFRFYLIAGILTVIPLWVTWLVVRFIFDLLSGLGSPVVVGFAHLLNRIFPAATGWLTPGWLQSLLAFLLTVIGLYILGRVASHVVGSRIIRFLDSLISRIPFAKTIYLNTKKFLTVLQREPGSKFERVALVEFPKPGMKVIAFVTRHMKDEKTGEELVSVFIPTIPNPTSGFLEIVPVKNLTMTDWGFEEAMQFIMSGGAGFPDKIPFFDPSLK